MTKRQFLFSLRDRLEELPPQEVEERLYFYSEMIDDRMEEGLSEEEAVASVGTVDRVAAQIMEETPPEKRKSFPKRKLKPWEITLLVLGSPLWVSLLIGAAAVAVSLYAAGWAVIVSLWAVFASLIGCALGGVIGGIVAASFSGAAGAALIGAGILCAGLAILMFLGCQAATKGICLLTKKVFRKRGAAK